MTRGGGSSLPGPEDEDPVDLGWLVRAGDAPEDDPAISAATSSPPLPSDRVSCPPLILDWITFATQGLLQPLEIE